MQDNFELGHRRRVTTDQTPKDEYNLTDHDVKRSDNVQEPYLQQHGTFQNVSPRSTYPPNPPQHQLKYYLIQTIQGKLNLKTSKNRHDNISLLIAYYSQYSDDSHVQLTLPRALGQEEEAALLSDASEFKILENPMANLKLPESSSSNTSSSFSGVRYISTVIHNVKSHMLSPV
jgi:hypothetical protein